MLQASWGRSSKQQQDPNSPNHVQVLFPGPVQSKKLQNYPSESPNLQIKILTLIRKNSRDCGDLVVNKYFSVFAGIVSFWTPASIMVYVYFKVCRVFRLVWIHSLLTSDQKFHCATKTSYNEAQLPSTKYCPRRDGPPCIIQRFQDRAFAFELMKSKFCKCHLCKYQKDGNFPDK